LQNHSAKMRGNEKRLHRAVFLYAISRGGGEGGMNE
jgi:hypothetical protein